MCSFVEASAEEDDEEATTEEAIKEPDEANVEGKKHKKRKSNKSNKSDKSNKSNKSNKSTSSMVSTKSNDTEYSHAKPTSKNVTKFKNLYYPPHETPVKNNVIIDKKIIITGPNAAGKTTVIKSIIKGGIKVLYDLEYPESIIANTKKILGFM